jgi:GrpB-like predicted nucleotidyltransferase (UPF0157 family)
MTRHVDVVPYRNDWPEKFKTEANDLRSIFRDQLISVYHFGSTSIPGASAKPIIDILLTLRQIEAADELTPRLAALGYHAVGEYGIPGRRFFYKGTDDFRSHHLHIYQYDNPHILRHIAFRDYMRSHPMSARQYSRLKEQLAFQFPDDMDSYITGKNEFVKEAELHALTWWREGKRQMTSD